jgi:ubiquinone/menaquinone biosynthesis C-methylase UbiE
MSAEQSPNDSTYMLSTESAAEMARLMHQDRLLTKGMGGLFPERNDVPTMRLILDVACGPGGWVLDVAHHYPDLEVVGIDISNSMIEYAQAQARVEQLGNVRFQIMDAMKPLHFPDNTFDLVNARFLVGFLPKAYWTMFVQECLRITRPGGVIRLTEFDEPGTTNSPAFEEWKAITFRAVSQAGLPSSPDGRHFGITPLLDHFLHKAGCQNIGQRVHVINFSLGSEAHKVMYDNCMVAFKLVQPFLIKLKVITQEEADQKYERMLQEMWAEDFCALWYYLTVWGQKPEE